MSVSSVAFQPLRAPLQWKIRFTVTSLHNIQAVCGELQAQAELGAGARLLQDKTSESDLLKIQVDQLTQQLQQKQGQLDQAAASNAAATQVLPHGCMLHACLILLCTRCKPFKHRPCDQSCLDGSDSSCRPNSTVYTAILCILVLSHDAMGTLQWVFVICE